MKSLCSCPWNFSFSLLTKSVFASTKKKFSVSTTLKFLSCVLSPGNSANIHICGPVVVGECAIVLIGAYYNHTPSIKMFS